MGNNYMKIRSGNFCFNSIIRVIFTIYNISYDYSFQSKIYYYKRMDLYRIYLYDNDNRAQKCIFFSEFNEYFITKTFFLNWSVSLVLKG